MRAKIGGRSYRVTRVPHTSPTSYDTQRQEWGELHSSPSTDLSPWRKSNEIGVVQGRHESQAVTTDCSRALGGESFDPRALIDVRLFKVRKSLLEQSQAKQPQHSGYASRDRSHNCSFSARSKKGPSIVRPKTYVFRTDWARPLSQLICAFPPTNQGEVFRTVCSKNLISSVRVRKKDKGEIEPVVFAASSGTGIR
jgi:hypothetical protein